jgi:hypothetical protein
MLLPRVPLLCGYPLVLSVADSLADQRRRFSPTGSESILGQANGERRRCGYGEEADALRQALLEIYVSIILKTPYNDFDTHRLARGDSPDAPCRSYSKGTTRR